MAAQATSVPQAFIVAMAVRPRLHVHKGRLVHRLGRGLLALVLGVRVDGIAILSGFLNQANFALVVSTVQIAPYILR